MDNTEGPECWARYRSDQLVMVSDHLQVTQTLLILHTKMANSVSHR
jgi:hypothetical protein